jgi:hypothetical protein
MSEDNNFAEFEAAATAGEPVEPTKEPEKASEPEAELEEVEDEAPEANDEKPEEEGEDKPEKRRSKPAHQRIAELTAKLRQTERDLEAAKKPAEPVNDAVTTPTTTLAKPDPNDAKYEFGEADPEYLADMMEYKVEVKLAEREAKEQEKAREAQSAEAAANLNKQWEEKAAKAVEKYPDFNEVVLESAAAGDWECGPILAIAISASDQGADIAYHLASNPKEAAELNKLAQTDPLEAARRFGRMEARFEAAAPNDNIERKVTKAPEPPKHQVRGGSGKFEVGGDTTDFAAFEAKVNGRR